MLIKITIILIITIIKQYESALPDNEADANIIKEITNNYNSEIRYFDSFFNIFLTFFEIQAIN